jgi:hypothetical protein
VKSVSKRQQHIGSVKAKAAATGASKRNSWHQPSLKNGGIIAKAAGENRWRISVENNKRKLKAKANENKHGGSQRKSIMASGESAESVGSSAAWRREENGIKLKRKRRKAAEKWRNIIIERKKSGGSKES